VSGRTIGGAWSWLVGKVRAAFRYPVVWVLLILVAAGLIGLVLENQMRKQAREDLQVTAMLRLMYQPGGLVFPAKFAEGLDMVWNLPVGMFEQLLASPSAACGLVGCEKSFGTKLSTQSIIIIATSVQDVRKRQADARSSLWTWVVSVVSFLISLSAFTITVMRASPERAPPKRIQLPTPPPKRKLRLR